MSQLGTKKSRRGCKRCKQRRVKCDEIAPCGNCVRRHEDCSLLLSPTASNGHTSELEPALPRNSEEWVDDLELMHHYTSSTVDTLLGKRGEVQALWRDYVPQQATKHDFLMHGLLAMAALHLAYSRPDAATKYVRLGDKHQAVALTRFRSILSCEIDPKLADALFALSSILSILSMARSCVQNEMCTLDMDAVKELFFLTRGVRDVIHTLYGQIREGPMFKMFEHVQFPDDASIILPPLLSSQFESIRHLLVQEFALDAELQGHCEAALEGMEKVYLHIQYFAPVSSIEVGQILSWTTAVSTEYIRLMEARHPAALIILSYFAAAFTSAREAWFTQNLAEYMLRGISLELDEGFRGWIAWPLKQLEERLVLLGVQSPDEREPSWPKPLLGS